MPEPTHGYCQITSFGPNPDPPDFVSICPNEVAASKLAGELKAGGYADTKYHRRKIRVEGLRIWVYVLVGWKTPAMNSR